LRRPDFLTTRNYGHQIKVIAVPKDRLIQLLYVPTIQQDVTVVPDGLLLFNTSGFDLFLIYGPVIRLHIFPGFLDAVYFYRYSSNTQEKPPRPDEVDIDFSQD